MHYIYSTFYIDFQRILWFGCFNYTLFFKAAYLHTCGKTKGIQDYCIHCTFRKYSELLKICDELNSLYELKVHIRLIYKFVWARLTYNSE